MIDWREVLCELAEMMRYFKICESNAGKGSVAASKFHKYIDTLNTLTEVVQEKLQEEDDGR